MPRDATDYIPAWGANSGNMRLEPGAVVTRVSHSFVRFGSFQLPASRGETQWPLVKTLADYVIRHHYPHIQGAPLIFYSINS